MTCLGFLLLSLATPSSFSLSRKGGRKTEKKKRSHTHIRGEKEERDGDDDNFSSFSLLVLLLVAVVGAKFFVIRDLSHSLPSSSSSSFCPLFTEDPSTFWAKFITVLLLLFSSHPFLLNFSLSSSFSRASKAEAISQGREREGWRELGGSLGKGRKVEKEMK